MLEVVNEPVIVSTFDFRIDGKDVDRKQEISDTLLLQRKSINESILIENNALKPRDRISTEWKQQMTSP